MTWVSGQTTWGNLVQTLTQLIAGEVADDQGVTVAAGHRWVRGTPGFDYLRTQPSQDVVIPGGDNRAGYWPMQSANGTWTANLTLRQTAVGSIAGLAAAFPATFGTTTRWYVTLTSTIWSYGGVVNGQTVYYIGIILTVFDADDPSKYWQQTYNGPFDATGTWVMPYGLGTIQNLSGAPLPPVAAYWELNTGRLFTTAYPGGVDWHPMLHKTYSNPTFSTPPPGVQGTDWDFARETTAPGSAWAFDSVIAHGLGGAGDTSGFGVGIKTNAALTGARYVWGDLTCALNRIRIFKDQNPSYVGSLMLHMGVAGAEGSAVHHYDGGWVDRTWLVPGGSGLVAATVVQYWMSVTASRIAIVLNADPGAGGTLTCAWVGVFQPDFPQYDKFPVACGGAAYTFAGNYSWASGGTGTPYPTLVTLFNLWGLMKRYLPLSMAAPRDYQTGWARTDLVGAPEAGLGWTVTPIGPNNGMAPYPRYDPRPNAVDGGWRLYGMTFMDAGSAVPNDQLAADETRRRRGHMGIEAGIAYVPGPGWSSGDELTDQSTGDKWFLVGAVYHGIYTRGIIGSNTYIGGAAIKEQ